MWKTFFIALCGSALLHAADPVKAVLTSAADRKAAPVLKLKDHNGSIVDLESFKGRVVLVDFWATWCGGCKQELPWFQEFQTKYRSQKFAVLAVSMDEGGWNVIQPFVDSIKLGLKVVADDGETSKRYEFQQMPAAFLIDNEGRLAGKYIGLVDRGDLERNIELLIAEKKIVGRR